MNTMMKFVLLALCLLVFVGCSTAKQDGQHEALGNEAEKTSVKQPDEKVNEMEKVKNDKVFTFLAPKSAPVLPALLMADGGAEDISIEVKTWDTIDQLLAQIQGNEADFTAVPLNVAANLHAKGLPIQLIDVNTWGTIFLVTTDTNVTSLADLEGEEIYVSHKSGPPDILLNHFLAEEGINDKVTLYYSTPPEISQMLIAGNIKHAVIPEPALSGVRLQLKDQLVQVVDFQESWHEIYGLDLPQAGIIVNKKFAAENQEAVEQFLQSYQEAIQLMKKDPEKVADLAESTIGMKAPMVKTALNHMMVHSVIASDAKPVIEQYYEILLQSQPEAIGGKLPDEGFYFSK
ncbi:hypothetical protein BKP45_14425 [Anaerobacillus alkalidiazotrophicus]|uniref:SsuA/THI5-like domain-containing protein n=1 Tax=Anaerobacillus alkalidiazotrophicus TaxID=472963 RepID=A0A1S2M5A4_9BACI|nr:MqnA/MqnD/SBP family protein [Anaerobacillus alkalidiazotrophicus]OIJ19047.1 hypothetical protein BKP45_14425 [Anaerobacillus alkalidiazotrophicus]